MPENSGGPASEMTMLDSVAADLFGKIVVSMESQRGRREASNVVGEDAAHDAYYYAEFFIAERAKRMPGPESEGDGDAST